MQSEAKNSWSWDKEDPTLESGIIETEARMSIVTGNQKMVVSEPGDFADDNELPVVEWKSMWR